MSTDTPDPTRQAMMVELKKVQRELGMTWSPLGMTRIPATLTVHAHLTPES